MKMYEMHSMKDARLPFIFHKTDMKANKTYSVENWHENVELLTITAGSGTVRLNERTVNVSAGDIVIVNSNCLHGFSTELGMKYYCLIVDRSFCIANHFDTNLLTFDEHVRDAELFELACVISEEFQSVNDNDFSVQLIRARVLLLMSLLCRRYSNKERLPQTDTRLLSCIKQAIGFIQNNSERDLSLDEAADFVGLSKYYFAREFKRITGYTFVVYLNLVRCKKAKRMLLETRKSVGEISRECGFSDQSYFTKVFKRYYGTNPADMRG